MCPILRGMTCNANSSIPFVQKGYWRSHEIDSPLFYQCIPIGACLKSGFSILTQCDTGYTGKRCGRCIANRFFNSQLCVECPAVWISWVMLCFFFIAFIGVYCYVLFRPKGTRSENCMIRSVISSIQALGVLSSCFESGKQSPAMSSVLSLLDLSYVNLLGFCSSNLTPKKVAQLLKFEKCKFLILCRTFSEPFSSWKLISFLSILTDALIYRSFSILDSSAPSETGILSTMLLTLILIAAVYTFLRVIYRPTIVKHYRNFLKNFC
jgi:hypothetical protein